MAKPYLWKTFGLGLAAATSLSFASVANAKTLGYVLTGWHHSGTFTPDNKLECPAGLSADGRMNFKAQFPTKEAQEEQIKKYAGFEMRARGPNGEMDLYSPELVEDPIPFPEAQGKISHGFSLDGTLDGHATAKTCVHPKFTSPTGETGIDNQYYRAMGCITGMRPRGDADAMANSQLLTKMVNRLVFEITGVDDETNDDKVELTIAHGLDKVLQGPSGKFIPGLTQRKDEKMTMLMFRVKAKIVNGVLISDELTKLELAQYPGPGDWGIRAFKNARVKINIKDGDNPTAVVAGYHDVEDLYRYWAKTNGIHSITATASPPSLYRAMHKNADGHKDPVTGKCTSISASYDYELVKAFIVPESSEGQKVSENAPSQAVANAQVAAVDQSSQGAD